MSTHQTGLALNDEKDLQRSQEYNIDAQMSRAMKEVEGAFIIAQRFKRNEDEAYQALMRSCKRSTFAERAEYKYPRGKKKDETTGRWVDNIVSGPSVYLSREAIRLWRNVQIGTEIVRDTEDERHIRSYALDLETNVRRFAEATFRKLIQRKVKDSNPPRTEWVRPDERDLRELSNKHAAICERNCSIQLLPDDFIQDARDASRQTMLRDAGADPDAAKKKLINAFDAINISVASLEAYIGHPIAECSPQEIADLRGVWSSINDGNSTWAELVESKADDTSGGTVTADQANEFFQTYMASGWKAPQASAWLDKAFKVKDGRKIPVDGFEKAMEWAKSKPSDPPAKTAAKPETKGEVISPNKNAAPEQAALVLDAADPVQNKIAQLFDILETPAKMREGLLHDYDGRLGDLAAELEGQLPQD